MSNLTPYEAASISEIVYKIQENPKRIKDEVSLITDLSKRYQFDNLSKFDSRSGAFFKARSSFGFIAKGKDGNNSTLVAIRGTASHADKLTDANVGLQVTSTGKIVHAGFNRVFKEIEKHLATNLPSGGEVLICGHSLGGALATLASDWATEKNGNTVKLYTFGAPRAGFSPFATNITNKVGTANIYRVHRKSDIVPMVPIWPFVHAPQPGKTCAIPSQGLSLGSAHAMENYIKSVGDKDWDLLLSPEEISSDSTENDLSNLQGINSLGTTALTLLGKAIKYILKTAGVLAQGAFIVGFSILDMLSMALEKAANVSAEIAGWVKLLIEKIISITGAGIAKIGDLTANFIRWIFQLLMSSIRRTVSLALPN